MEAGEGEGLTRGLAAVLKLSGRPVAVIGGGAVGMRKLAAILESGAAARVIDPRPLPELPPQVVHVAESYRTAHLDGAALAFACATPEVNAQVVSDCHARGIWVNSASSPEDCDFTLPATVRRGELLLAVSTSGASPALARRIREKWDGEFDAAFAQWLRILAEVRAEVLALVADETRRSALLKGFADWNWLARLRAEGAEAVLAAMREMVRHASGAA